MSKTLRVQIPSAALFFALALALTWACWVPAALLGSGARAGLGATLVQVGSAGPLLAALLILCAPRQRDERARWWRRLTCTAGLASPAGAFAVLLPLLIGQLALDSFVANGGIRMPSPLLGDVAKLLLPTFVAAALPELGWRGYALPVLLRGRDPLAPTLLLAGVWSLWQLPLFFVPGTYQAGIELASAAGLIYFVTLASQSLLMTALYLATRCTWAAVLFQWLTCMIGELWQLPIAVEIHRSLWTLLAAGAVLLAAPPFGLRLARKARGDETA